MNELEKVAEAASRAASARQELHKAVKRAAKKHSLREVASAASLSHEQVRRIAS